MQIGRWVFRTMFSVLSKPSKVALTTPRERIKVIMEIHRRHGKGS